MEELSADEVGLWAAGPEGAGGPHSGERAPGPFLGPFPDPEEKPGCGKERY